MTDRRSIEPVDTGFDVAVLDHGIFVLVMGDAHSRLVEHTYVRDMIERPYEQGRDSTYSKAHGKVKLSRYTPDGTIVVANEDCLHTRQTPTPTHIMMLNDLSCYSLIVHVDTDTDRHSLTDTTSYHPPFASMANPPQLAYIRTGPGK